MSTISNGSVTLHVEDSGGDGRPVVLVHGWPLSGASWSDQVPALTGAGYRVVDLRPPRLRRERQARRRLRLRLRHADQRPRRRADRARPARRHPRRLLDGRWRGGPLPRQRRLRRGCTARSSRPPSRRASSSTTTTPTAPSTTTRSRACRPALEADPRGFLDGFTRNFFSADGELKVTEAQQQEALGLGLQADVHAARECIRSWTTDFTADLATVTVPTLVIHGDSDAIVPIEKSGQRTHEQVAGSELHVVEGGPHGINTSHTAGVQPRAAGVPRALTSPVTTFPPDPRTFTFAPQRFWCEGEGSLIGRESCARGGRGVGQASGSDAGGRLSMPASLRCSGRDRGRGVGQRVVAAAATSGTR